MEYKKAIQEIIASLLSLFVEKAPDLSSSAIYLDKSGVYHRDFPRALDSALVAFRYDSTLKVLIEDFKYRGDREVADLFLSALLETLRRYHVEGVDCITFVPSQRLRWIVRAYNQSEILARMLAQDLGVPCSPVLTRTSLWSRRQARLNKSDRLKNMRGKFSVKADTEKYIHNKKILLIDDVISTGSTACECALVLKSAGAREVVGLFVATGE